MRRADVDYSPRTNDPARASGGIYPPRGLEQRSRSESDNWRYTNSVQQVSSSERLAPLRRAFAEPPASAPVVATRTSPIGSVFPRLSAILSRHSRFLVRDIPEDVREGEGYSDSEVPPAYESLTPRRGPSQASQQARSSVRPLPQPTIPSPASS
jgi:hypothetical protein